MAKVPKKKKKDVTQTDAFRFNLIRLLREQDHKRKEREKKKKKGKKK